MAEAESGGDGAEDMEEEEVEPDEDPDDTLEHCMKRKYNAECEDGSIVVAEPKQFWHLIAPADAPAPSYVALLIGLWHYRGHEDKVQLDVHWLYRPMDARNHLADHGIEMVEESHSKEILFSDHQDISCPEVRNRCGSLKRPVKSIVFFESFPNLHDPFVAREIAKAEFFCARTLLRAQEGPYEPPRVVSNAEALGILQGDGGAYDVLRSHVDHEREKFRRQKQRTLSVPTAELLPWLKRQFPSIDDVIILERCKSCRENLLEIVSQLSVLVPPAQPLDYIGLFESIAKKSEIESDGEIFSSDPESASAKEKCPVCKFSFKAKSLSNHVVKCRVKHGLDEGDRVKCNGCGKYLLSKKHLRAHLTGGFCHNTDDLGSGRNGNERDHAGGDDGELHDEDDVDGDAAGGIDDDDDDDDADLFDVDEGSLGSDGGGAKTEKSANSAAAVSAPSTLCARCKRSFSSVAMLEGHTCIPVKVEPDKTASKPASGVPSAVDSMFRCSACSKSFDTAMGLKVHQRRYCPVSKVAASPSTSATDTDAPLKVTSAKPTGEFKCVVCSKEFGSITGVKVHMGLMHKSDGNTKSPEHVRGPVRCEKCAHFCNSEEELRAHCAQYHPKRKKRVVSDLERKLKVAQGDHPNPLECHVCKGVFKSPAGVLSHLTRVHALQADGGGSIGGRAIGGSKTANSMGEVAVDADVMAGDDNDDDDDDVFDDEVQDVVPIKKKAWLASNSASTPAPIPARTVTVAAPPTADVVAAAAAAALRPAQPRNSGPLDLGSILKSGQFMSPAAVGGDVEEPPLPISAPSATSAPSAFGPIAPRVRSRSRSRERAPLARDERSYQQPRGDERPNEKKRPRDEERPVAFGPIAPRVSRSRSRSRERAPLARDERSYQQPRRDERPHEQTRPWDEERRARHDGDRLYGRGVDHRRDDSSKRPRQDDRYERQRFDDRASNHHHHRGREDDHQARRVDDHRERGRSHSREDERSHHRHMSISPSLLQHSEPFLPPSVSQQQQNVGQFNHLTTSQQSMLVHLLRIVASSPNNTSPSNILALETDPTARSQLAQRIKDAFGRYKDMIDTCKSRQLLLERTPGYLTLTNRGHEFFSSIVPQQQPQQRPQQQPLRHVSGQPQRPQANESHWSKDAIRLASHASVDANRDPRLSRAGRVVSPTSQQQNHPAELSVVSLVNDAAALGLEYSKPSFRK